VLDKLDPYPACIQNGNFDLIAYNSAMRLLITDLERFERAAAPDTVPVSMTSKNVLISSIVHRMPRTVAHSAPRWHFKPFANREHRVHHARTKPGREDGPYWLQHKQEWPTCN